MKGEFVQEHVGRKAARGIRVGRQRRDARAARKLDFQRLVHRIVPAPFDSMASMRRVVGPRVAVYAFFHGFASLPFASGQDHPAPALTERRRFQAVVDDFQAWW